MRAFRLAHLYPSELNLYGDRGNIICLESRLKRRGFEVKDIPVEQGEPLPDFDLLFIGGGQDREMKLLSRDIRLKGEALSCAIEKNKVILAICGGYQLLGDYYKTSDGDMLKLSGALPFYTLGGSERMIGNIVFETEAGTAVGFENHSGKTYLNGLPPLGRVVSGFGNNGEDKTEGLRYKNTFGTYAHGPLLPKNPALCDLLLSLALCEELSPLDDALEYRCNSELIRRFK